jgi:periplasmic divalent cation tolerance protein
VRVQVENATGACIVLTTWPASAPTGPFARALVDESLAACVHIAPAGTSIYRWQGAIETAEEHTVLIKTTHGRLEALEARVRTLHPYEVPEWLVVEVGGSDAYLGWLAASVAVGGA